MICKSNKLKFITQGLMGPNIIFPAAYILFSAEMCSSFSNDKKRGHIGGLSLSSLTNQVKQAHVIEGLNGSNALGVKALLGSGALFNLGDCQCGVFVASETEEAFICKLPLEGGWMSLCQETNDLGIVDVHYDAVEDARIIKVDHALVKLLGQQLGQSSDSWRHMAFFYKTPVGDSNIFTEDSITPATAFTKKIYKKLSNPIIGTGSLISSKLSITGKVASDTLAHGIKRGFLLVKDASSLVRLVKDMLESGAEWGTTATVVPTRDYIIAPASLVGGALQADARDLDLQSQDAHSSLRLEGYTSAYCYLKDGAYYRLIALDHVKSSVEIDKEQRYERFYTGITTPTVVPPEQLVPENETITSRVATASQSKLELQEIQVTCEHNDVLPSPLSNPLDQLGSVGSSLLNQAQKDKSVDAIDRLFTDQAQAPALVQKVNLASVLLTPPPSPLPQTNEELNGTDVQHIRSKSRCFPPPLPPRSCSLPSTMSGNNRSSAAKVAIEDDRVAQDGNPHFQYSFGLSEYGYIEQNPPCSFSTFGKGPNGNSSNQFSFLKEFSSQRSDTTLLTYIEKMKDQRKQEAEEEEAQQLMDVYSILQCRKDLGIDSNSGNDSDSEPGSDSEGEWDD